MTLNIYLSQTDLELCGDFAEAIQKRHKHTSQAKMVDQSGDRFEVDYAAKACEVAVARCLGQSPNYIISDQKGGDNGYDLVLPGRVQCMETDKDGTGGNSKAHTIDVKHSTAYGARLLIWPITKELSRAADILIFVTSHKPTAQAFGTFEIHGWITRYQFMKLADTAPPGDSLREGTRSFPAACLTPIDLLRR